MTSNSPFKVLVYSKTTGYRHDSIPAGIRCIQTLSNRSEHFTVDATEDASLFNTSNLSQYAVVVLLQTIGEIFNAEQLDALKHFIRNGGGVVGIHGAANGMPKDEWYEKLIGAHFDMHPDPEPGTLLVENDHFILSGCGGRGEWMDEWYNFHTHPRTNSNLKVLLRGDTKSFKGGKHGDDHPLSWCQEFDGGRSWYTALGHFDEAYEDEWFVGQILRGIMWTAGREDSN